MLKHRILHYSLVKACKIINACTVLHNICIENNIIDEVDIEVNDLEIFEPVINEEADGQGLNEDLAAGKRMQRRVIRYFT